MTCSSIYFNPMNVRSRYTHTTRKALRKFPPMKKKKKKNLHAKQIVHQIQPRIVYIFFAIFRIMCTRLLNGGITKPNFRGIYKLRLFIAVVLADLLSCPHNTQIHKNHDHHG